MLQQEIGEVKESEDGSVEFETPMDDEETTTRTTDTLAGIQKCREVPDIPDI